MITLQDFCLYLESYLQSGKFTDYCPNGLQVQGNPSIYKIATAVSASAATIEEAVKRKVQALVVHHGLFWQRDPHVIVGVRYDKIKALIENGISLLAFHIPLDAHPEVGNNWVAAKKLGWSKLEPFCLVNKVPIGVKGSFPPIARTHFLRQLEEFYGHSATHALGGKDTVETAALVSGGSYKEMSQAIQEGVDCFITGNFDEPAWNQAFEEKINFFAMGHTATERVGPQALGEHLKSRFGIEYEFIDTENPF